MGQFSGYFLNKLDQKGRVSVPSTYRDVLKEHSRDGSKDMPLAPVVLRPSLAFACIEGLSQAAFEDLKTPLQDYDPLSQDYEDLSLALFGDAVHTEADKDGRIVIPDALREHANLKSENVMFIGANRTFQIWEPEAGRQRLAEAKARAVALTRRPGRAAA